ncbi:N-acetylmuramoyl-L-alanine amidase [Lachnospiraceae bacterium]|nr:N-acetylmuramoyl-L-alanine amidase [Lachnospiraceae bacterium]
MTGLLNKKRISAILILCVILSLAGCGKKKEEPTTETTESAELGLTDSDGFVTVKDYVATLQDNVRIRREAKEDADVYITLDKGVNLTRTGIKDEWTRVLLNGSSFYVQSKYVEETNIKWATETEVERTSHIVYIDPAKQISEDMTFEPVSPDIEAPSGATKATFTDALGMKRKMTSSAVGVDSGVFEYDITMKIAEYLNAELVKRGYTVYMSRTTNNVDLSNAKRTQMSNACGAEIYIKLQTPAVNDPSASGVLGFITTSTNSHTASRYQNNYELCYDILKEACENTDARRMGIYETDDMTSLNYSDVPATVINMGFLSNELDDVYLNDDGYRKKMAQGIANGIDLYFNETK